MVKKIAHAKQYETNIFKNTLCVYFVLAEILLLKIGPALKSGLCTH